MPRPPRSTRTAPLFPYTTLVRSRQLETVALPQLRRTIGAMQDENRLAVRPFNMDMSGTMIVRIDHDPQAIYAQDSRHCRTRSEEHTSELQSLMRISYAVFCLKKKKDNIQDTTELYTYIK